MTCPRCNGLMVSDVYMATKWAETDDVVFYRCVCCGNCVDELIMQHRRYTSAVKEGKVCK